MHHPSLYISKPLLYDYNVKVPIFTFCRGREHKTTTFLFFSWTLIQSFRTQLQKNFANIWCIKRDKISAKKFEAARIHFLSDVFVDRHRRCCLSSLMSWVDGRKTKRPCIWTTWCPISMTTSLRFVILGVRTCRTRGWRKTQRREHLRT